MKKELKPCPFCNSKSQTMEDDEYFGYRYSLVCNGCNLLTPRFKTVEELIVYWETRS